ncbi:MAG: 3'-5' exonuclease [Candidatus Tectomicrobia bacterium]|nr:3'-5' exonuclease [Candidatus Tectomicrobia bacterium]
MILNQQPESLLGRLRLGVQRQFGATSLLADPWQRAVYDDLRALKPRSITRTPVSRTRFVVIDTETTGLHAYAGDEIISIALVELRGFTVTGRTLSTLVNPRRPIPPESTAIHHLTNADVADAPVIEEVLPDVVRFIGRSVLVGHHVNFDLRFLNKTLRKQCLCRLRHPWLDTMMLYSAVSGRLGHYTLEEVAEFCQVELRKRHTAYGDAVMTAFMFKWLAERLTNGRHPVSKLIKWQTQVGFF